jgi:hypothetical protein
MSRREGARVEGPTPFDNNLEGTGQTILIVDAFGSPTIKRDLEVFDATFGLPAPPSFTILCPQDGHSNIKTTLGIYSHAVDSNKLAAQEQFLGKLLPNESTQ